WQLNDRRDRSTRDAFPGAGDFRLRSRSALDEVWRGRAEDKINLHRSVGRVGYIQLQQLWRFSGERPQPFSTEFSDHVDAAKPLHWNFRAGRLASDPEPAD